MSITIFGVIVILVGLALLLSGSMIAMLAFVMVTCLFGGSAAFSLPSLGGSTIPPANLALVFLLLRAIMPGPRQMAELGRALSDNVALMIFGFYGSITAYLLPRLFAGAAKVTPLRPGAVRQLYEVAPVHFSSQNITTSVYLLGTTAAGLCGTIGAARPGSERVIVRVGIIIAILHAALGFISVAVANTRLNAIIDAFRNGHYAQLDQSIGGLSRMTGIWPEASGFAAFGGAWLIFMTELWLRGIKPKATGFAAVFLTSALALSTSSTAYVTLLGYAGVLGLRTLLVPTSIPIRKVLLGFAALLAAAILALAVVVLLPPDVRRFHQDHRRHDRRQGGELVGPPAAVLGPCRGCRLLSFRPASASAQARFAPRACSPPSSGRWASLALRASPSICCARSGRCTPRPGSPMSPMSARRSAPRRAGRHCSC